MRSIVHQLLENRRHTRLSDIGSIAQVSVFDRGLSEGGAAMETSDDVHIQLQRRVRRIQLEFPREIIMLEAMSLKSRTTNFHPRRTACSRSHAARG